MNLALTLPKPHQIQWGINITLSTFSAILTNASGRCETTEHGRFCYSTNGGSLTMGGGGLPVGFGLMPGDFGMLPDDLADELTGFVGKLGQGGFDFKGLKGIMDNMMGMIEKMEGRLGAPRPKATSLPAGLPAPKGTVNTSPGTTVAPVTTAALKSTVSPAVAKDHA
jgi:hypothetical protein